MEIAIIASPEEVFNALLENPLGTKPEHLNIYPSPASDAVVGTTYQIGSSATVTLLEKSLNESLKFSAQIGGMKHQIFYRIIPNGQSTILQIETATESTDYALRIAFNIIGNLAWKRTLRDVKKYVESKK